MDEEPKPVRWVGSSRRDLRAFPGPVRRDVGQALFAAQCGEEYPTVKALKGFAGRSVLEIVATSASGHVSRGLHDSVSGSGVCVARVPEKIE
jgi:phage-related protein